MGCAATALHRDNTWPTWRRGVVTADEMRPVKDGRRDLDPTIPFFPSSAFLGEGGLLCFDTPGTINVGDGVMGGRCSCLRAMRGVTGPLCRKFLVWPGCCRARGWQETCLSCPVLPPVGHPVSSGHSHSPHAEFSWVGFPANKVLPQGEVLPQGAHSLFLTLSFSSAGCNGKWSWVRISAPDLPD